MLFNSYIFVFLFLPLCILGYFTLNHFHFYKISLLFLLSMSLWFYGYFNIRYLPIILFSILFNYAVCLLLRPKWRRPVRMLLLILAAGANVGVLFYFKYYDFFMDTVNHIFHTDFTMKHLLLPLGISFFSFQQLSFVIDSYRREVPRYGFIEYALFVTYFPQLIAGPIVTHDELVPQLLDASRKQVQWENIRKGLYLFSLGMAKKVLLADTFGNAANWGFENIGQLDSINAFLVMMSYTIQIYFDFSGYCDMAGGISRMMNLSLPLNFNSPYKAFTITEFWDRWHMTLTRFFTRYVYIPLGGNRKGAARTYFNTMIVFLISGLWHGADWTFILWGALHGLFSVITKKWKTFFDGMHPALNWLVTFGFLNATWVLFRADTIRDALRILYRIARLQFSGINSSLVRCFNLTELTFLFQTVFRCPILNKYPYFFLVCFFAFSLIAILGARNAWEKTEQSTPSLKNSFLTAFLLIWSICSFSGVSTFLYFNF